MKLTANIWTESQQKKNKTKKNCGFFLVLVQILVLVRILILILITMAIIFLTQKIFAEIFLRTCRGQKILRFLFLFIHPTTQSRWLHSRVGLCLRFSPTGEFFLNNVVSCCSRGSIGFSLMAQKHFKTHLDGIFSKLSKSFMID